MMEVLSLVRNQMMTALFVLDPYGNLSVTKRTNCRCDTSMHLTECMQSIYHKNHKNKIPWISWKFWKLCQQKPRKILLLCQIWQNNFLMHMEIHISTTENCKYNVKKLVWIEIVLQYQVCIQDTKLGSPLQKCPVALPQKYHGKLPQENSCVLGTFYHRKSAVVLMIKVIVVKIFLWYYSYLLATVIFLL